MGSLTSRCLSNNPLNQVVFQPPRWTRSQLQFLKFDTLLESAGAIIPLIHLRSGDPTSRRCLIYSHGNATDISHRDIYYAFFDSLDVDVIGYDYVGYSWAQQYPVTPTAEKCYQNLLDTVDYALDTGYRPENIILVGRSVGSGVTAMYAARHPDTYGRVVLESPMKSIARIKVDSSLIHPIDLFPTHQYIERIRTPLLLIHGTDDEIIPFYHGRELYEKHARLMRKAGREPHPPLWIDGAGHNNLVEVVGIERYLGTYESFLEWKF